MGLKVFLGVRHLNDELIGVLQEHRLELFLDEGTRAEVNRIPFKRVGVSGCLVERPNVLFVELERPSTAGNEYEQLDALDADRVTLLLWAVKNYREVVPVSDLEDFKMVLEEAKKSGDVPLQLRRRLALKTLHGVIRFLSSIQKRLSDVFFVKEWMSLALEKLGSVGNYSLFSEEKDWNVPPELSIDVALAVHYLSLLPEGACVLVRRWTPVYAAIDGSLPQDSDGVLGLKGEYTGGKGYKFVVARKIPEGVPGLEVQDFRTLECGMLAFGSFALVRENTQEGDFVTTLASHPVLNSAVLVREGKLIKSSLALDEEEVKIDLLRGSKRLDNVEIACNFALDEEFVLTLKERGAKRVSFLDSRGIWRRS